MTRKTYRTALGKTVDLGALMLQNENTRAVGNMKVNARGDLLDSWNRPIDRRTQQVQKQYDRQVTNVSDEPVAMSETKAAPEAKPKSTSKEKTSKNNAKPLSQESQGLAAAIARAKQFRQEPDSDESGPRRI